MRSYPRLLIGCLVCCLACLGLGTSCGKQGAQADAPTPEEVIRRVADFYRKADSFEVDFAQTTNIETEGLKQQTVSQSQIVAERPNRLAMRTKTGSQGFDVMSDGKQLYTSMPILGRYTKAPAPQTFDELLTNPQFALLGLAGNRGPLFELLSTEPYAKIMEGVTATAYVGRETIDGIAAHHLKFTQNVDWHLWVAAEGEPLVCQMSIDAGKALAQAGPTAKLFEKMKITSVQSYKNWRFNTKPGANAFTFQPPPGAKEARNLLTGAGQQDFSKLFDGFKGARGKQDVRVEIQQAKDHQLAWAKGAGAQVEVYNSIGMKMCLIPPGEFLMGSPQAEIDQLVQTTSDEHIKNIYRGQGPEHRVQLTKAFYLGCHEVTQQQYQDLMGVNPSGFAPNGSGKGAVEGLDTSLHPVETVSWFDAVDFCNKLSEKEGLPPCYSRDGGAVTLLAGRGYRLPTEAEWEYACRGGTTTLWSFGDNEQDTPKHARFRANGADRTHPVGQLEANPYGLYDMHGNVWEWCWDWFGQYPAVPFSDPTGSAVGNRRVLRGGNIVDDPSYARSAFRYVFEPEAKYSHFGFRVARSY